MTDRTTSDDALERAFLAKTLSILDEALLDVQRSIDSTSGAISDQKRHMWEHQRDMDHAEKANMRTMVDTAAVVGDHAVRARRRLERLLDSPYFGRVQFCREPGDAPRGHYIGVHSVRSPDSRELRVHDWRAPLSSLYYDYETGPASYCAPEGTVTGEIIAKRQYKISGGELHYVVDSAINIGDEVLQRELSRSVDDKMRTIVATIQREQNAVIRNESAEVLILQGVPGSGKTSIALHRVAFLLYRYAGELSAEDVLVLSPNRVFADYVSNVLPELGEDEVPQIGFEDIARRHLPARMRFETFGEQVASLLVGSTPASAERITFTSRPEIIRELEEWIAECESRFTPADITASGEIAPEHWVRDAFDAARTAPLFTRLDRVADSAIHRLKQQCAARSRKWTANDSTRVRAQVRAMLPLRDAVEVYRRFYDHPDRQHLRPPSRAAHVAHCDVGPLLYVVLRTERHEGFPAVKHLLVDEMQDYTPVQYAVLRLLFRCRMTILGDAHQSVNPLSSSSMETIAGMFPDADTLRLRKSYRSTRAITEFAQRISRNDDLEPVDRPGPEPQVLAYATGADETAGIIQLVTAHTMSELRSLGIICKTLPEARRQFDRLRAAGVELSLLDEDSTTFASGTIITSAHLSKGLEFDEVILPHVDSANYATETDRRMLYIGCTRAMHRLHLTFVGSASPLFPAASGEH